MKTLESQGTSLFVLEIFVCEWREEEAMVAETGASMAKVQGDAFQKRDARTASWDMMP